MKPFLLYIIVLSISIFVIFIVGFNNINSMIIKSKIFDEQTTSISTSMNGTIKPSITLTPDLIEDKLNKNIPETIPDDIDNESALNAFASSLFKEHVKPNIFSAYILLDQGWKLQVFSDHEKENARKAIKLIIEATSKSIALNDKNEHIHYLRGAAYAQCFYDSKDTNCKKNGLLDFEKAMAMGLTIAKSDYDMLNSAE